MGGFSGGNPLVQAGGGIIDSMVGMPVASMALGAAQAHAQALAQRDTARQMYDRQAALIQQEQDRQVRAKANLLARSQASARAAMGAMGISGAGGSGDALIQGMNAEANQQIADINAGFDNRLSDLTWGFEKQDHALEQADQNRMASFGLDAVDKIKKRLPGPLVPDDSPYPGARLPTTSLL